MTHRYVVAASFVLALLFVTACTSGDGTVISESSDTVVATKAAPPSAVDHSERGVIFDGSAGATKAGDAVTGLLASINSGDVLGALAHIDPAERDLIADLYLTAVENSAETWPQFRGHDAIAELKVDVLTVTPRRTTQFNDHLAWVETDEVEFYMAAPTEVAAAFFDDTAPWGPGSGLTREDIAWSEDDWSEFTYLFGDSSDVLPGLMVTKLDGRWYVSFGRTMLELLRIDAEYETAFPAERNAIVTTPSPTPENAVLEFLKALADDRMAAAAGHLVAAEGQAFADYPAMLDSWLAGLLAVDVDLDPNSLTVVSEQDGRAVVETTEIALTITGLDHDEGEFDEQDVMFEHQLQLANRCLTIDDDTLCEPTQYADSVFAAIYRDLGWDGLRLVAVQGVDGWSVSLYETISHYGLPIMSDPLSWLGHSDYSIAFSDGLFAYTLINETAKTLPLQETEQISLEPQARNRFSIARIKTSEQGQVLWIDQSTLARDCRIMIWNTDMVTEDWSEQPEYYDDEYCDSYSERPLEIPAGIELTLTLWGYEEFLESTVVELR